MAIWGTSCLGGKGEYQKALPKSQEWGRAAASFFATMKLDFGFQARRPSCFQWMSTRVLLVNELWQLWPAFFWKINVGSLQNYGKLHLDHPQVLGFNILNINAHGHGREGPLVIARPTACATSSST